jgi:molybdate-binding protein
MSIQWRCAPGTVQRAYQELAQQGLVVSRTGQGTRVADAAPGRDQTLLRRATLVHDRVVPVRHPDRWLIRGRRTGVRLRWIAGASSEKPQPVPGPRCVSSAATIRQYQARCSLADQAPPALDIAFAGSLGGLIALAEYKAEIAGSHLWDEETDTYNRPFVQRLLPGRRAALLTLAHRRLGLIVQPGNPAELEGLGDLARPGLRFVNRQPGAGTRVWLDAQLHRRGIDPVLINGYEEQFFTHSEVARAVGERRAEVGLGIEAAALFMA